MTLKRRISGPLGEKETRRRGLVVCSILEDLSCQSIVANIVQVRISTERGSIEVGMRHATKVVFLTKKSPHTERTDTHSHALGPALTQEVLGEEDGCKE